MSDQKPADPQDTGANPDEKNTPPGNPDEGNNGGDKKKVEIDAEELEKLRSDAGRWNKRKTADRKARRDARRSQRSNKDDSTDDLDDESLEIVRRSQEEAESAKREAFELKLEKKVDALLESDDYKDLSPAAKRLLKKNPMAYVNPKSETIEDAVLDIEDFLDDELDNLVDTKVEKKPEEKTPETPPVKSGGPSKTGGDDDYSVEGKTGVARSTTVLKGLFKKQGISQK